MSGLDVEAVLRDHAFVISGICACGENVGLTHRAHVAAVLRVEIESALADAWDEGWAARAQTRMPFLSAVHLDANPYRASQAATEGDRQ